MSGHCTCSKNGLRCTDLCKCINCENEDLRFENVDTEEVEQTGINDVELPSREDENDS